MIETRYDRERGCGWRKPGGLYLVADGPTAACERLYLPLSLCQTCGCGIKPSRGWTWVLMPALVAETEPMHCSKSYCEHCPLNPHRPSERMGLLWCGEQFYKTPEAWIREAETQGVSRRIAALPKDFVLGQTWVLMAHRKAIQGLDEKGAIIYRPGIIHAFRPSAVEYVVTGAETEEELARMNKRGITPIQVERAQAQGALL